MANELRDLVKQERNILKTFDSVKLFVEGFDVEVHSVQVDIRLERLEIAFKEFHNVRRKIELLTDDVDDDEEDAAMDPKKDAENAMIIMDAEDKYCTLKAILMSLRPKLIDPTANTQPVAHVAGAGLSRVKLPEIRLPTFSGPLKEWVTFRDTFRSLIHNNPQLTDMEKFTYLRSSLNGEALQEINSV
ncbi:uncharacterized protein LOC135697895 [Ochlerotatus camptorhynchus]|uniref:uncharacterized protein LOC135697895 n=1 Tax=Ochlerotatus camptorhynchus TaxID=644619 RepID=UPI0031DD6F52